MKILKHKNGCDIKHSITEELKELEKIEEEKSFEDDSSELPPSDIVAYNELRSCADLFRMYDKKQLKIQPEFQREIVWPKPAQTRFIDSLIKQLPIPSMCISLDYKTDKRLVIDGLQRIQSIINFLSDDTWRLSALEDIDSRISGKTVLSIKAKNRELYERVENLTIPITILRCDYTKESHNNYLFTIFHRLNTGGTKLNNQEIRNCIYSGIFNDFLKNCAGYLNWKKLMDIKENIVYRFSNEELILRFFTFFDRHKKYNGRLAKYLNSYMSEKRDVSEREIENKRILFERTTNLIYQRILDNCPLKESSKAVTEGLLVGVAKSIDFLEGLTDQQIKGLYSKFRNAEAFSIENLKEGLSARNKVIERLDMAISIFSSVD
jgi:hypothetical protein